MKDIMDIVQRLANQIKAIIIANLKEYGLGNSKIAKTLSVEEQGSLITVMAEDYMDYVNTGRRPGTYPPPEAIAQWCAENSLPTDNSTVFLISRSIFNNGIQPRPFADDALEEIDDIWDEWAEKIFEAISDNIEEED